jgi:hypothetical protein
MIVRPAFSTAIYEEIVVANPSHRSRLLATGTKRPGQWADSPIAPV